MKDYSKAEELLATTENFIRAPEGGQTLRAWEELVWACFSIETGNAEHDWAAARRRAEMLVEAQFSVRDLGPL